MKKNININLQGIIFHIEEDGYEQLSRYLASIRQYFSNYEGHEEIVADIEARIAEIFSMRLSPGKQVITLDDVNALVAQMGNVTDFEILEPMEEEIPHAAGPHATTGEATATTATASSKRLYRDVARKVISGVSAGIANYLNVDPLWIRLLFVFLVIGTPITDGISGSFGIILYIILWIALPVNHSLPETTVKKLFRDPTDKKLGGVASGIAKYFGVDVAVIRILFLVSIFLGGFGIIAYIVLWIAVPEASTLTEKMQMEGSPVTLASIERSLKDNLNMRDNNGEESTAAKILLLPIRLISQIISWLGKALGPLFTFLVSFIRVAAGILLIVISLGLTVALFATFFASLGLVDDYQNIMLGDYPASVIMEGFPRLGLVTGFLVGLIPLIFLILLGVGLLAKRFFMRPIVGWSMFGVWLVSLFIMIATIAMYSQNYRRTGEIEIAQTVPVGNYQTLTLDAYDTNRDYRRVYVDVQAHNGNDLEVLQRIEAKGKTEEEAKYNAQMVTYRMVQRDSILRFDNSYEFKENAAFRNQRLNLTLLVPTDKQLRVTRNFVSMVPSSNFEGNYSSDKIVRNTWQAKGDRFVCLTCAADTLDTDSDYAYTNESGAFAMSGSVLMDESEYGTDTERYNFSDFNRISISGPYHLQLRQGNSHSISVRGDRDDIEKMRVSKKGSELEIKPRQRVFNLFSNEKPVLVQITVPELRTLELAGAIRADVDGIKTDRLDLALAGAIRSNINVDAKSIKADIAGASQSTITGRTNRLDLDIAGAGNLDASNLQADAIDADLVGACKADVYATRSLRASATGASSIRYKGNPKDVTTDATGASKVTRY